MARPNTDLAEFNLEADFERVSETKGQQIGSKMNTLDVDIPLKMFVERSTGSRGKFYIHKKHEDACNKSVVSKRSLSKVSQGDKNFKLKQLSPTNC